MFITHEFFDLDMVPLNLCIHLETKQGMPCTCMLVKIQSINKKSMYDIMYTIIAVTA